MVSLVPVYFLCQSQVLINGVSCIRKGVYSKVLEGSKTQIIKKEISILEQLGPGSSTTASGVVDQQGENCMSAEDGGKGREWEGMLGRSERGKEEDVRGC